MIDIAPNFEDVLSGPALRRFLKRARTVVGLGGEVDVLLTDDRELRRLNREFRGKNKPTDVLSFPSPEEIANEHAGDLAISLETAARQAAAYDHTLDAEVRILLLHGLLHLSGMDHEIDGGEMAVRESALRKELRLSNTLIERVEGPAKTTKGKTVKKDVKQSSSTTKARARTAIKPPLAVRSRAKSTTKPRARRSA